jgi:26S proteasome regulatory subunit N2
MSAITGMVVFCQYWYWFPLAHFLSVTFTPTCLIGLNKDLKMPALEFVSNTKPSMFDYPPMTEVKTAAAPKKVATAILSTTAKTKARKKESKKEEGEKMDVVKEEGDSKGDSKGDKKDAMEDGEKAEKKAADEGVEGVIKEGDKDGKKEKEPSTTMLANPARVLPAQKKYVAMPAGSRYEPVSKKLWGMVLLRDLKPNEAVELVEVTVPATVQAEVKEEDEPPPPEPFEYTET